MAKFVNKLFLISVLSCLWGTGINNAYGANSADGTVLNAGSSGSIVNAQGTWTFSAALGPGGNDILLNGAQAGGGSASLILIYNGGQIYVYQSVYNAWWLWSATGWNEVSGDPRGSGPTSPNGTVVNAGSGGSIVTSAGTWSFSTALGPGGNDILFNGVQAGDGSASLLLLYNNEIYVYQGDYNAWWVWSGTGWNSVSGDPRGTTPIAPSITTQPVSQTVTAPATATFTVAATGTPVPTYQWQQEAPGAGSYTAISSATSASYTTSATTTANSGTKYECVVTNTAGTVTSNAATLTVNPAITYTITATAGSNGSISPSGASIVNSGASQTYTITPNSGYIVASILINGTALTGTLPSSYTFSNVTSNQTISVSFGTTNLSPNGTVVNAGSGGSIITSAGTWSFSTALGPGGNDILFDGVQVGGGSASLLLLYNNEIYVYQSDYNAWWIWSGSGWNEVSGDPRGTTPILPSITTQPVSQTVTASATATFTVAATGTPAPTYQWQQEAPGAGSYTAISSATSASYTTPATTTANSGTKYECVVTNTAGTVTSNAATLTVNPAITYTITATAGSNGSISPSGASIVNSGASQTYTITPNSGYIIAGILINGTALTGTLPTSYTFSNVTSNQTISVSFGTTNLSPNGTVVNAGSGGSIITSAGTWSFSTALGPGGNDILFDGVQVGGGSASLLLLYNNEIYVYQSDYNAWWIWSGSGWNEVSGDPRGTTPILPSITTQPVSQTVTASATATFTVAATGTPAPTYQWQQEAPGAGSYTAISSATSASYSTPATTTANSGTKYECVVTNTAGTVTSNAATLTVNPAITYTITATAGSNGSISPSGASIVNSGASQTYTITPNSGYIIAGILINGTSLTTLSSSYTFSNVTSNQTISVSFSTTNLSPNGTVVNAGSGGSIVTSAGTWSFSTALGPGGNDILFDGVQVGGGSASLLLLYNNEIYVYQSVYNAWWIWSGTGWNEVSGDPRPAIAPSITTQPVSQTVTAPATAAFSVVVTGTPAPTYQWMQEAAGTSSYTNISGATGPSYTTPATTTANSGTRYECVVTNTAGTVTSTAATLTVTSLPVVAITSPASGFAQVGSNVTFTATASEVNGIISKVTFYNFSTPLGTATSSPYTYTLSNVAVETYEITAVATDSNGVTGTSSPVFIFNITGSPSVSITSPVNQSTFTAGSNISITANASEAYGGTISQVAFYNGTTLLGNATSSPYTYTWTNVAAGTYNLTAVATDGIGTTTTSPVITVTVNPVSVAPVITIQPVNATVTAPATATFTVAATGTPAPTYQWQQEAAGTTGFRPISGATGASYTTPATTASNSGTQYDCVVTNAAGTVTSTPATLTVNQATVPPVIVVQPVNAAVRSPSTATFTILADGTPTPAYQWQQEPAGAAGFTPISGATSASYTTPATTIANSGTRYDCVVTNTAGTVTSNAATLTINPTFDVVTDSSGNIVTDSSGDTVTDTSAPSGLAPSITTQPANETVTTPSTATFTLIATGTPSPTYQWMQEAPGAPNFSAISGATSISYTTPATTLANSGTLYECVITNASGTVTSNPASLTVNATSTQISPTVTIQPASLTVTSPATATFTVAATGTPAPGYQWIQEAPNTASYTLISGATGASYTTAATTTANSGTQYECVVTNTAGSVTSTAATLTVYSVPSITTQPVNATVTVPATATFSVAATGTPTPTYQWQQEATGASTYTIISGATSSSYTTPATSLANSGTQYECVVTNIAGSVTSNAATLSVTTAPTITTQPLNQTVTATLTATFTVVAAGTPAPTYQWQQKAPGATSYSTISGATGASYTTPPTTMANNGTLYECVASNTFGSVTSSAATLTVTAPVAPSITTQPANTTAIAPATATFTVAATGAPAPDYQWQQEAPGAATYMTISGATGASYTTPPTALSNSGTKFECVVTNTAGTVTSNPATLTVNLQPTVSIVSPVNQSSFAAGSVNITAIATEIGGGTIANVAFYDGETLLGTITSTSQAFTYTLLPNASGEHNIFAVATDGNGTRVTSSTVTITIQELTGGVNVTDNIASMTDARDHTTTYQYDNSNRPLKTIFADGSMVSETYDLFGNQISVTDQRGNTLTKTYDAYERLSETKDPDNGITQYTYDNQGNLLTLTDANGHATNYTYDADYRVLTQTNALNLTTTFTYDPVGNIATRTDANSQTTKYTYDALNRLTNTGYPDGTSIVNTFDALGRKISMTDSTGETTYTYDALSRLLSKTAPGTDSTITYTYDSEGNRLTSVDQNNRTISNVYDSLNRLYSVTDPNGTTTYGYDADSNKISVASPNGVTETYTYDALNRVLTAVNATSSDVITSFTNVYDIAGMIIKKTLQDGSWTAYTYDALNRLLSEEKQTSTAIIYDYVYTYDLVGNRLTWSKNTTLGGFWSVDYLNMPAQVLTNMTNAGYGNTANQTQALSLVRTYVYDAANRLSDWNYAVDIYSTSFAIQTDAYTYDNNGNRLTKKVTWTGEGIMAPKQTSYTYDFENRLIQCNYQGQPIDTSEDDTLTYNGEGLRTQAVRKTVTASGENVTNTSNYLYDGTNVLIEEDGSGNTTKTYTRGMDAGGGIGSLINQNFTINGTATTQYYDYTDLGSTADTTTSSGAAANSYTYDAYGNLLNPQASDDTNTHLFSTKEFDGGIGLYYFGNRYYDPEIGRWLTQDPLGIRGGDINFYVYVNNNPINLVDPYGLSALTDTDTTSTGVGSIIGSTIGGVISGWYGAAQGWITGAEISANRYMATVVTNDGPIVAEDYTEAVGLGSRIGSPIGAFVYGYFGSSIGGSIGDSFDSSCDGALNCGEQQMLDNYDSQQIIGNEPQPDFSNLQAPNLGGKENAAAVGI